MNHTFLRSLRLGSVLGLLLLATSTIFSCKKESANNNELAGIWQGKWGGPNQDPENFIRFELKGDGTLTRLNEQNQVIANGTWKLDGIQFECSYTHTEAAGGQTHMIGGLYTDFDHVIVGTWGYNSSKADGGTIELSKQ